MRWRRKEAESIDHRISQRATNRDTRLIYICESWISLFIDSPVFSHLQFIPEKKKKKKKEKISPLRVSTNSTRGIQLRQPLTRDFSSFTIASALSSGWDHQWTRYPLQETFFKERCAFSRKWHAAEARVNERHRCRAFSRRSLIGRRGITRRTMHTRCPPISKPSSPSCLPREEEEDSLKLSKYYSSSIFARWKKFPPAIIIIVITRTIIDRLQSRSMPTRSYTPCIFTIGA